MSITNEEVNKKMLELFELVTTQIQTIEKQNKDLEDRIKKIEDELQAKRPFA